MDHEIGARSRRRVNLERSGRQKAGMAARNLALAAQAANQTVKMAQDEDAKALTGSFDVSSASYRSFPTSAGLVASSELRTRPKNRFETPRMRRTSPCRTFARPRGLGLVHTLPFSVRIEVAVGGKLRFYRKHVVECSGLSKTEISSGGRFNGTTSFYDNPRARQSWPFWPAFLSELSLRARTIYVTVRRRRETRVARHHRSADSIIRGIDGATVHKKAFGFRSFGSHP